VNAESNGNFIFVSQRVLFYLFLSRSKAKNRTKPEAVNLSEFQYFGCNLKNKSIIITESLLFICLQT